MKNPRLSTPILSLLAFGLILVLAFFSYRPGEGGGLQLDDRANLGDLEHVEDLQTALDFILAGDAGPLGRPLSLASFALQADSWDQAPEAFIRVNLLIHLVNAALLAWCLFRLGTLRGIDADRASVAAVAAAGVWVTMPLLATATLLVVQRMTTLSAFFVLAGLAAYLEARRGIESKPTRALVGMSVSLGCGTLLSALCKESGLLMPVLVLALEGTLLESPRNVRRGLWRTWVSVCLLLPLVLLLGYLLRLVDYPETVSLRRGFDAGERLMTEARVLWVYLYKAVAGFPGQLGIYQSPPDVARSLFAPKTFVAVAAWVGLLAGALFRRRRFPLAAFAVFWFLGGHLIESTLVPLELYFEHRNYLPVVGPVFAAASGLAAAGPAAWRGLLLLAPVCVLGNAWLLHGFASLSGEPSVAARYWAISYPDSQRAVTNLAAFQLREEGPLAALQTIDRFVIRHPEHAYLRVPELNLRCRYMPAASHAVVIDELLVGLPDAGFTYSAGDMLSELYETVSAGGCNGVDADVVIRLAESLRSNPLYARDRLYNQFHFKLLASIARRRGDIARALDYLRTAAAYGHTSELNMMVVTALADSGDFDGARIFIDDARQHGPASPLAALRWQRDLRQLRDYTDELEKQVQ